MMRLNGTLQAIGWYMVSKVIERKEKDQCRFDLISIAG